MIVILALSAIAIAANAQRVVADGMVTEWTGNGDMYYYGPAGSHRLDVIHIRPFDQMGIVFDPGEVLYSVELYRDGYFFTTSCGMYICNNRGFVSRVPRAPRYGSLSGMYFGYNGYRYGYNGCLGRINRATNIGGQVGGNIGAAVGGIIGIIQNVKAKKEAKKHYEQMQNNYNGNHYENRDGGHYESNSGRRSYRSYSR